MAPSSQSIAALLRCFELCLAQSATVRRRDCAISAPPRFDHRKPQVRRSEPPANPDSLRKLRAAIGERTVIAAASTHAGEETVDDRRPPSLARHFPRLLTIIAPRHPERGPGIFDIAKAANLTARLRSRGELPGTHTEIYVADTLGELGLFYRVAPVAFLGGSLVAHGGQNPIEPVRLDAAILHGPHVRNFESIYTALDGAGAAERIVDAESLAAAVGALLEDDAALRRRLVGATAHAQLPSQAPLRRRRGRSRHTLPPGREGQAAREVTARVLVATRPERREPGARSAGQALGPAVRRMARPPAFRAPVPVVCVGNFVLGGAGKTPTAIAVGGLLASRGAADVSDPRLWRARTGPLRVDPNVHRATDVGDEPLLLARAAPTIVARARVAGAAAAVNAGASVIVMDDGFQNPALAKDFRAACGSISGRGVGNGLVTPAGPPARAARRATRTRSCRCW